MHACALARELRVPRVIVPPNPGHFSAWGMLTSDLRHDVVQTRVVRSDRLAPGDLDAIWRRLEERLRETFSQETADEAQLAFARSADLRYAGQEHTVNVPVGDREPIAETTRHFHALHEQLYAFRLDAAAEFVNFRLTGFGAVRKPELPLLPRGDGARSASKGSRDVDFDALGRHEAGIYERGGLGAGAEVEGPAVIEEPAASTVVFPGQRLRVDERGNLIVDTDPES